MVIGMMDVTIYSLTNTYYYATTTVLLSALADAAVCPAKYGMGGQGSEAAGLR